MTLPIHSRRKKKWPNIPWALKKQANEAIKTGASIRYEFKDMEPLSEQKKRICQLYVLGEKVEYIAAVTKTTIQVVSVTVHRVRLRFGHDCIRRKQRKQKQKQ